MASQPIPKYHIAPNFAIPPVEAGGTLELGSIIANVVSADEPINEDCHVRIPPARLFCSHQRGFTATRSSLASGEYGVWAKFLGIADVGGELSWAAERSAEDVYAFRAIDTIYFHPSQDCLERSMDQDDVKDYVAGSGFGPVYMVTGLKTARGPSVKMSKGRKLAATVEMGLQQPGGLPVELGPKFAHSRESRQEVSFEDSTDFVVGLRVKKLVYKKHWFSRKAGRELIAQEFNKGAVMVDDDVVVKSSDEVVELDDDSEGKTEIETEVDGEVLETEWIVSRT